MARVKRPSDQNTPADRHRSIEALLDKGYQPADIARAIEQQHCVSRRQAERDIRTVKAQRGDRLLRCPPGELHAEHYHSLKHIYRESLRKEDFQTALKALALQEEIINQYVSTGEKQHALSDSARISPDELETLMAALGKERLDD